MEKFDPAVLKQLYISPPDSHKGQNGKLLVIAGSPLFHAASLWALKIASRIVDMVFYSSVPENNDIVQKNKEEFRDGIVVRRDDIENYISESDCILIGPGMERSDNKLPKSNDELSLKEINALENEGEKTYYLTKFLLQKHPDKKWVIDAGALQMIDKDWLKDLKNVIITPHPLEFERVFGVKPDKVSAWKNAKEYGCVILLKGKEDIVCSPEQCITVNGGNAGMTKGGTGDVLAGLTTALACKNDSFLAACAASYFNKKAGEALYKMVGPYFNASDLADKLPEVMKEELII